MSGINGKENWPAARTADQCGEQSGTPLSNIASLTQAGEFVNAARLPFYQALVRGDSQPGQPSGQTLKLNSQALQGYLKELAIQAAIRKVALRLADRSHWRERSQDEALRKETKALRRRGLEAVRRAVSGEDGPKGRKP